MNRLSVSRAGVALAVAAVLGYAGGVLLGYPVLIGLAVGLLALLAGCAVLVSLRPAVVLTRRVEPERVTVDEPAQGRLVVRNTSRWPSPSFTALDRAGAASLDLAVGPLGPGRSRTVRYAVPTGQRGRLRLGPLTVERRDPLGLFTWAQRQTADGVLWVHPRVHPMRPLPVGVVLDYEGRSSQNARLGTVTFASLREYTQGDDPRHIHWRSTARLGTLVVREHVDTTEPTTTVVLDTRADRLDPAVFEEAVQVAASVVAAVERIGRPVALHVVNESYLDHVLSNEDRLTLAEREPDPDPLSLLATLDRAQAGGALVVVTGDAEPGVLTRIAEQRTRFSPVVVAALLPAAHGGAAGTRRRPGLALLSARSAPELAAEWNRLVGR